MPLTNLSFTMQRAFPADRPSLLDGIQLYPGVSLTDQAILPLEFNQDGECTNTNVKVAIVEVLANSIYSSIETIVTILKNAFGYQNQLNEIIQDVKQFGDTLIFDGSVLEELQFDGITLVQDDAGLVTMHKSVPLRQQEISNSIGGFLPDKDALALISFYDIHAMSDEYFTPLTSEFIEESIAYLDTFNESAEDPDLVMQIKLRFIELEKDPTITKDLSVEELRLLDKARSVFMKQND